MEQYGLVPDRGVISILVVLTLVWIVVRFALGPMSPVLAHIVLIPARAIGPEPWQLVTNFFVDLRFQAVFMSAITLLFFGNAVERHMGAAGVWKVFVLGGIGASIFAGLVGRLIAPQAVLGGSAAAATAMLTAFAAVAVNMRLSFFGSGEIRPGTMAWIWLGISVIFAVLQYEDIGWQGVVLNLCMLAGAAGAGWLAAGGRRTRGGFDVGASFDKWKLWRLKRRYKVLSGGRDSRDTKNYLN
jgi:membrane associated rhomboid family serine protease